MTDNLLERRLARFENDMETAFREIDDDRVVDAFGPVVFGQLLSQPPDLHPDSRFLARVVGRRLAQRVDCDRVFLQVVSRARERSVDQIGEEMAQNVRASKSLALEDSLDLGARAASTSSTMVVVLIVNPAYFLRR